MRRALIILLVVIDVLIALGGLPFFVIAGAYINADATTTNTALAVLFACWVVAPWAALIVARRQSRRGAGRRRIALILLVPIMLALVAQAILERLPTHGV